MCRSIKVLRRPGLAATPDELSGAALQFVRKISGFNKPSRANQEAFGRLWPRLRRVAGDCWTRLKKAKARLRTPEVVENA